MRRIPDALDGAVECGEHATPDTEVTSEDGSASLDGSEGCSTTVSAVCFVM